MNDLQSMESREAPSRSIQKGQAMEAMTAAVIVSLFIWSSGVVIAIWMA